MNVKIRIFLTHNLILFFNFHHTFQISNKSLRSNNKNSLRLKGFPFENYGNETFNEKVYVP